jgi:hypothetical protein
MFGYFFGSCVLSRTRFNSANSYRAGLFIVETDLAGI